MGEEVGEVMGRARLCEALKSLVRNVAFMLSEMGSHQRVLR